MQLIGQENNLKIIDSWDNLPPFVIIQGDEHMGKNYLVLYLCKKYGLYYNKMSNKVEDIRDLLRKMVAGSKMVYHFDNFHTASLAAKNALLKITEEPKEGNYIIITGGPQLKTLESRARRIVMNPYSEAEIKQFMRAYYPDEHLQDMLLECGINSPAKVEYYKKYDKIEGISQFAIDIANKITYISPDIVIGMMRRFENRYEDIDAYLLFIVMLINVLENKIKTSGYYSYEKYIPILVEGKNALLRTPSLKRKMLVFNMFYKIYQTNKVA